MQQILRLAHLAGLILFLGSIITFILISAMLEGASPDNIAFGRRLISSGTATLTLPGMWLIAVSGIWLGIRRYGTSPAMVLLKLLIVSIVIINAHFFVMPAVSLATELAIQSVAVGSLVPEYAGAYLRESLFGAVNVLLTLTAAVIGIWKFKPAARSGR